MSHKNQFGQILGPPIQDLMVQNVTVANQRLLRGRTCVLERLDVEAHTQGLFESFSKDDGSMWTYLSIGPFSGYKEFEVMLFTRFHNSLTCYVVKDAISDRALGFLCYLRINPSHASIEIGSVVFSPLLRRTTMATEAVYLLLNEAFDLGYRRVEWKCDNLNSKSKSAAIRFGFKPEGVHRKAVIYKGRSRDTAWFSMLSEEWSSGIKEAYEKWLDPNNFDEDGIQVEKLLTNTDDDK